MNKTEFWKLLEAAKSTAANNQELQEKFLINSLVELSPECIVEFECILREYIIEADDFKIMAAQKIIDGYVSDDPYLYFRCWLIGQGEEVFKAALQNPDSLVNVITDPYQDFEALLYVATHAFEQVTGREEDESFPREIAASRGLEYDFNVETKGEDWEESQLPKMYPKLWKKFGS